ncbi:uncharacterized protein P884DRAFT_60291 [Thermothelomyces heterothallicus CBS 202.75]|uniref:uncharacterized protein n=1 Tax=Thermothelomyces heterothallicus CBS 202.75 TaxID=1149848 RepID=UPI0037441A13
MGTMFGRSIYILLFLHRYAIARRSLSSYIQRKPYLIRRIYIHRSLRGGFRVVVCGPAAPLGAKPGPALRDGSGEGSSKSVQMTGRLIYSFSHLMCSRVCVHALATI